MTAFGEPYFGQLRQELCNYFFPSGFIKPKKKTAEANAEAAKAAAVKKPFRQLALRFHPDKAQDSRRSGLGKRMSGWERVKLGQG